MAIFRSFRPRIALLTGILAAIVFALFSFIAYATIYSELEKSVDTRIMLEAPRFHGAGIWLRADRDGFPGRRPRPPAESENENEEEDEDDADEDARQVFAYAVTWRGIVPSVPGQPGPELDGNEGTGEKREELTRSSNWPSGLPTDAASYGAGEAIPPSDIQDIIRGRRRGRSPEGFGRGGPGSRSRPDGEVRGEPESPAEDASGASERDETTQSQSGEATPEARPNGNRPPGDRGRRGGGMRRMNWMFRFRLVEEPHFHYRTAGGQRWRVGVFTGDVTEIIVAASIDEFSANVQKLRNAFFIAIPSAIALIALGAWFVSGQAIRPIRRITEKAETLTAAGLSERLPEPDTGDELQRLSVVLNSMLNRLEGSFKQATRFSADASHELKTPLTIMQGELEGALREAKPGSQEQSVFASQLEEVTRLKSIVASLLLLSRADAGQLRLTRERIDISQNLADVCEDAEILATQACIQLSSDIKPGLSIMGDRSLLQQVLQNLIANAVKYNHPGGSVICRLFGEDSLVVFEIENTGAGIPREDHAKVFRRFHRGDAARGRNVDGFGLGLNLALEIARAHRGTLSLEHSDENRTVFRLTIPKA